MAETDDALNDTKFSLTKRRLFFMQQAYSSTASAGAEWLKDGVQAIDFLQHALTERDAQIERLVRERDEAIREMSWWASKSGEAEGRLKASEWHGVVEGWKDRATTAERERDEARAVCTQVETWWLGQGMHAFHGAPACIFNLRALLHHARAALTNGGENGDA